MADLSAPVRRVLGRSPIQPPAFLATFDTPAATRGRGGDLDAAVWSTARLAPNPVVGVNTVYRNNHIRHATIPANNRATFAGGTSVYPPDDMLICDGTSTNPGTLMQGVVVQNYGSHLFLARQPFDLAGRTGTIGFDVDAVNFGELGWSVDCGFLDQPVPSPTYHVLQNHEPGPACRNGLILAFYDNGGDNAHVGLAVVWVSTNYAGVQITPSFSLTGSALPTTSVTHLNRFRVYLSASHLAVWASDFSVDNVTFPALKKIWEADVTLPFTRGYVYWGARNHASVKFSIAPTGVYHWDNCRFDGPVLAAPRAYEIPDNTATGTSSDVTELDYPYACMALSYELSDGSSRATGIWNPTSLISPFSLAGVTLTGMTTAQLTLTLFVQSVTHTADTTWGLLTRWNGGTWRTRNLTAAEVSSLNTDAASDGFLCLVVDLVFADLVTGTNTLDLSTVNVPMDYPPMVQNIDLILSP